MENQMFKNLKLSMKISMGFAVVLTITVVMGICAWYGFQKNGELMSLKNNGDESMEHLNQCASLRRDFVIYGFEKKGPDNENAAEKWNHSYTELVSSLNKLKESKSLGKEEKECVQKVLSDGQAYKAIFGEIVTAQSLKDEAFSNWSKIGWEITNSINSAIDEVIEPAIHKATQNNNIEALSQWTRVESGLDQDVVQNFLLQRIYAINLTKTEKDAQWQAYQEQLKKSQAGLAEWTQLVNGDQSLEKTANEIKRSLEQYAATGKDFYNAVLTSRKADADMAVSVKSVVDNMNVLKTTLEEKIDSVTASTNVFLMVLIAAGVVVGVVLAIVITRSIVKPINQIIQDLTDGAQQVAAASTQVSSASQSLAEGATEQAAGLEETSSSLEEMSSMTRQNADNAQQANLLASETSKSANEGVSSMAHMNRAIEEIRASSDETAKIIKVIDEIAFQTNLLALNAAVEAARAGEAGKGFAVVAEEVRNLAIRSAEAAKNTSSLIEESVKNAQNGVGISVEVTRVFEEIVQKIDRTSNLISEITAASQEQAQGIDQVNTAVGQMDKVTQQNAANAEESASASEELSAQAEQMNSVVQRLVSLVTGTSEKDLSVSSYSKAGSLGTSDRLYHQIARSIPSTSQNTPAETVSTGKDFNDFDM